MAIDFTLADARTNLAQELSAPVHPSQRDAFLADMTRQLSERRVVSMSIVIEVASVLQAKYLGVRPTAFQTIGPKRNRTGDLSDDPAVRAKVLRTRARRARQRAKKMRSKDRC
jgi:hypothetical protein